MRNIVIGVILGLLLGGGIAWAAGTFTWVLPGGNLIGTMDNPIFVINQ